MPVDRLTILWDKYLADDMSPTERHEFKGLCEDPAYQEKLEELALSVFENERFSVVQGIVSDKESVFLEIMKREKASQAPVRSMTRSRRILRWTWAAAVLLLAVGAWLWSPQPQKKRPVVVNSSVDADIAPGKDGAILTLANGSKVLLDSIKNGVVALHAGATAKLVNGTLTYETTGANWGYNTVSTPRARHFHLVLPDGTEVWLNSVSSIRYPTSFTGNRRDVSITGEVYFEVAHNSEMPFYVIVNNKATVEVKGTHFNINAYDNESSINTTLLEGRVNVVAMGYSAILKPGEQAKATATKMTIDHSADIDKVMAWKNGVFNFEDVSLKDAMKQLERWYDIDVIYEGEIPDIYFTGKLSKDISLNGLLKLLEDAKVHFRMEPNRRLVVTQ